MKSLFPFVLCAALLLPALAEQVEAMKHGSAQAEVAAQARVDASAKIPIRRVIQPEAQRSFNDRAAAVAERRRSAPACPAPSRRRVDASSGQARGTLVALRHWR